MGSSEHRRRFGLCELLFITSIAGLSGCHNPWPFAGPTAYLDNAQFMHAWETYLHCRSTSEPEEIRTDLRRLSVVAQRVTTQNRLSPVLPEAIRMLVTKPPSRLAVDPHDMMAACALHGGEVAQVVDQPELAVELLTLVVTAQKGGAYAHHPVDAGRVFIRD